MPEPIHWDRAAAVIAMFAFGCFGLSLIVPAPWLILAAWLEERSKTKRILAEARLAEAKAALLRAQGGENAKA